MTPATLQRRDAVAVLHLTEGENRFNPASFDAIEGCLDEVVADPPGALVITGKEKFFSNGLDLDWMASAGSSEAINENVRRMHALFARLLAMPLISVAAINGHAFAGGAMLALACDVRIMREDRGYLCLPEVEIGLPFTPGLAALITAKLPAQTAHEMMVTGRRYTAAEAITAGVVSESASQAEVLDRSVERAAGLAGKPAAGIETIKRGLHGEAIALLEGFTGVQEEVAGRFG